MQNEQKQLKTYLKPIPLSVASLYGEQLGKQKSNCLEQNSIETVQFQPRKPRSRRKGAKTRRRLKKQREKEKREAEQAALLALLSASTTGGVGPMQGMATAGPSKSLKRVSTNLDASNFSDAPPIKRLKADNQKYGQPTPGLIKIAIVPINYPDRRLDDNEVGLIIRLIKLHILGLPSSMKVPTFKNTWTMEGAVIFSCADNQTREWLKSFVSDVIIKEGVQVHVLPADELFERHCIVVHAGDPEMSVKETLEFLDKQNEGLAVNEWIVACGSEGKDVASSYFSALVNDCTLEVLKDIEFKPFCGLGQATVKLLKKEGK